MCGASFLKKKIHFLDGIEFPDPVFPFKITFVPTGAVHFQTEKPSSHQEFMDQFKQITAGMNLYTFKAHNGPEDMEGKEYVYTVFYMILIWTILSIGTIVKLLEKSYTRIA